MRWPAGVDHITGLPESFAFAWGPYLCGSPVVVDFTPVRMATDGSACFHLPLTVLSVPAMPKASHGICDLMPRRSPKADSPDSPKAQYGVQAHDVLPR